MQVSSQDTPITHALTDTDYERLRQDLSQELKQEVRRTGRQYLLSLTLQAGTLVFLAVMLFVAARRYHDLMLWGIGLCLLLISAMQFLELEFLHSGQSWLDLFRSKSAPPPADPHSEPQ